MLKPQDIDTIREVVRDELFASQLREHLDFKVDDDTRRKIAEGIEQLERGEFVTSEALEAELGIRPV